MITRLEPSVSLIQLPAPRAAVTIRPGRLDDIPFMDELQRMHSRQVGWMPTAQFEGKIRAGHVLVAEGAADSAERIADREGAGRSATGHRLSAGVPAGYIIGNDRYFKRDDVGIIYQVNVSPGKQRGLVGAALVKAMFDRAAYGCRLFCCWCAQDIEANRFWEALGFVPLAFRAGGRHGGAKARRHAGQPVPAARIHIFWQRRIRQGDTSTPYWFPAQTASGSIREDRLVLPIPPGTHWSQAKPVVLPGMSEFEGPGEVGAGQLPAGSEDRPRRLPGKVSRTQQSARGIQISISAGGLRFAEPQVGKTAAGQTPAPRKRKPLPRKNDPKLVAAARELRDRWLEHVNAGMYLPGPGGKYDVSRLIEPPTEPAPLLEARLAA